VASGLYNNASELVREALRLLLEQDRDRAEEEPPRREVIRARLASLEEPLRRKGVTAAALFGSMARDEAGPTSDIDILIDIDPGARFTLVDLAALAAFLEDRLGHPVDVVTREGLDPSLRERILRDADQVFP
jgi:predicted nucleotidyltransferase